MLVQAVIELPSGRFARIDEDGNFEGVSARGYNAWNGIIAHPENDLTAIRDAIFVLFGVKS